MLVYATLRTEVDVNPIDVLKEINIIPPHDWILEVDGEYVHMTEESAGQHSFEVSVGYVTKEKYDAYLAKQTLIEYLKNKTK